MCLYPAGKGESELRSPWTSSLMPYAYRLWLKRDKKETGIEQKGGMRRLNLSSMKKSFLFSSDRLFPLWETFCNVGLCCPKRMNNKSLCILCQAENSISAWKDGLKQGFVSHKLG